MRIAVFGASGLTGGLVVTQALEQDRDVVALVRDPDRAALKHARLVVLGGGPTSTGDVERCVRGADAVVHCLGIGRTGAGKRTTHLSDSVKALLAVMEQHGVPRIVYMSKVVEDPEKPLRVSGDGRTIGLATTASSAVRLLLAQLSASDYVRSTPSISNRGGR